MGVSVCVFVCEGVYVKSVEQGSAAEKAGIKEGDIIIKLGSDEVKSVADLTAAKKAYRAGDTVTLTVLREGERLEISMTLDEKKPAAPKSADP